MKQLWNITIEDYFEVVKRAKARGIKAGESIEEVFIEYMEEKNKKPFGATELSTDELLKEQASHGLNPLAIETDEEGKQTYKIVKKKEEK